MVVERNQLFSKNTFEGFQAARPDNFEEKILKSFKYLERGVAEIDPAHKQPIGYSVIVNRDLNKVFAYQRSADDKRYREKRLQGKWSWGVGGHIEKFDVKQGNPIRESTLREIEEEIDLKDILKLHLLGYINSEADAVSQVHFGILYVVETSAAEINPRDPEIERGQFRDILFLENLLTSPEIQVESWSRFALEPIKHFLSYKKN